MRAALYARVSTTDQNDRMQFDELEKYAQSRGWTVAVMEGDQISGAKAKRPGLDRILKRAHRRDFDVVLVWKLDRFGRSVQDLLANLKTLESAGVRFIAITQGIDTDQSNPVSRLILQVLAAIAEFERELIRERTTAGVAKYKRDLEAGKAQSRSGKNLPPHRPKRIFDRDEVMRLRLGGMSLKKIAQIIGIGEGTVYRAVQAHAKSCTQTSGVERGKETTNPGHDTPATN